MQTFLSRPHQPTTFLERGACVPFTSPMLAGARVRPAARCGLEVLLPNPSGGRGIYVVSWTDLNGLCRPTVHDTLLMQRVAALQTVTPTRIRQVAKQIAAQGLAGRAASSAATATIAVEQESALLTRHQLLLRLLQQEEALGNGVSLAKIALEQRVRRTIEGMAPRLDQKPDSIAAALESLADLYDPIGFAHRSSLARLPLALNLLKLLRHEAVTLPAPADEQAPALMKILVNTADITIAAVEQAFAEAQAAGETIAGLLAAWFADPAALSRQLTRADWLMDGWERICRLWSIDPHVTPRSDALDEIATLLPVVQREVGEWADLDVDVAPVVQARHPLHGGEDWRTGQSVHDLIARNEALLAA